MKATILNSNYERSDTLIAQGRDVARYERMGYVKGNGGYGTYRMNKPAVAEVSFEANGTYHTQSVRGLILDYYGMQRVTKNKLNQFVKDCNSGIIDLHYSDNVGLYIN